MNPATAHAPGLTNILVVDDDEVDRVTLRRYLAAAGVSSIIDELAEGHGVVERMQRYAYDCLILDHCLPDETALDVIARIRAAGLTTPILCVAAQEEEVGAALVAAGATDFLPKSDLSPARLVRRLRYALRLGFAERQANALRAEYDVQRRLLNAVVAQLPTALAVVDTTLDRVLIINTPAERVLGPQGVALRAAADPMASDARALMAKALATGEAAYSAEPVAHGDRRFRLGAGPVQDELGTLAVVIVVDDVTGVVDATATAERSLAAHQKILAMASNDLRGPLSAISMALDGLAGDTLQGPERARYVRSMEGSVRRASRLIDDVLTAEQLHAGTLQVRPRVVSVPELLDDIARDHEQLAGRSGMSIVTSVDPATRGVLADPDRLRHALTNLLSNALRYASGSGSIELAAHPADRFVELIVRDHGPGIPEEAWSRVFDRHWHGHERRSGAGLGLAIVHGIVQAHGGRVAITTTDGGGATISLTLPAVADDHR